MSKYDFNYEVEYYIYYNTVKLIVFLYERLKFMSILTCMP